MLLTLLLGFSLYARADEREPAKTDNKPATKPELGRSFKVFDDGVFDLGDSKKATENKKSAYGYERGVDISDDIMASDQMKLMQSCTIPGNEDLEKRRNCYTEQKKKLKAERRKQIEQVERNQAQRGSQNPVKEVLDSRKPTNEE